ncbi:MAG: methyltransferase domain-containing protein, partial [Phenylobacterium sp.]|uniref:methionine biosynthesis protein MetW n=1 Tax=Phenylobacterium sp. TaxID=1871053 RepID=UPI001A4B1859
MSAIREDFAEILKLVRPGARVLDVGCEDGELLELLTREKQVDGQGLEISAEGVARGVARGLSVVQGDGDRDLDHFPTRAFDYAILSKTLQQMREPRHVLSEL